MGSEMKPLYVRIAHAPEIFGIGISTIYGMSDRGEIKIYKRGSTSLIKVEEMERAIEGESLPPVGPDVGLIPR